MSDLFRLANRYSKLIREARSENGFPGDDDEDFVMFFENMVSVSPPEQQKLIAVHKEQFAKMFGQMYSGIQADFPKLSRKLGEIENLLRQYKLEPYLDSEILAKMDELKKEFESSNHKNFREYIS